MVASTSSPASSTPRQFASCSVRAPANDRPWEDELIGVRQNLWCLLAPILCVQLLLGAPARGADPASGLLERAARSYDRLEYEKALKALDQALQQPNNSRKTLIRIYRLQGLCLSSMKRLPGARRAFTRLLSLEPGIELGQNASPVIEGPFDAAKKRAAALEVDFVPPAEASSRRSLSFSCRALSDPGELVKAVKIRLRRDSQSKWATIQGKCPASTAVLQVGAPIWAPAGATGDLHWHARIEGSFQARLVELSGTLPVSPPPQASAPEPPSADSPWYTQWWVWSVVGAVAVAGATTAGVLASRDAPGRDSVKFQVDYSIQP